MKKRIKYCLSAMMAISLTITGLTGCSTSNKGSSQATTAYVENTENAQDKISYPTPSIKGNLPDKRPEANEDFYAYVNYDLLKESEIPAGKARYSSFDQVDEENKENMCDLFQNSEPNEEEKAVFEYFNKYVNWDSRNADGWKDLKPVIDKIQSTQSMNEMYELIKTDDTVRYFFEILMFGTQNDFKDSAYKRAYVYSPYLDLEDSAEYKEITERGKKIKEADDAYYKKLLLKYGFDEKEADQYIADRFSLETKMAEHMMDVETSYREDYFELIYNPYTKEELIKDAGSYPIEELIDVGFLPDTDKYIVTEPEFLKSIGDILCDDNLGEIKAWFAIQIFSEAAQYTDEEAFQYYIDWANAKMGSTGKEKTEIYAYEEVCDIFPELVGKIYTDHFFSQEEKEDVENIVRDFIDVYQARLDAVDWMGEETKAYAKEKLESMGIYVGYPEKLLYNYSALSYNPDQSLFMNRLAFMTEMYTQRLGFVDQKDDRECWGTVMAPNVMNACYDLTTNSIYFPAAILQAPFYNKDASYAANMGGVGTVIGHEITHAFDTKGSQFDKEGNMKNWWTEEDKKEFRKRTKAVGERYARYDILNGQCSNADLVIGETVADLGGVAAALQILEAKEDAGEAIDYHEFFEENGKIWFMLLTSELQEKYLKIDPHAPACLRVNVNLPQFDKFYETYPVKEGDFMYTAPEDRLKVW